MNTPVKQLRKTSGVVLTTFLDGVNDEKGDLRWTVHRSTRGLTLFLNGSRGESFIFSKSISRDGVNVNKWKAPSGLSTGGKKGRTKKTF